MIEWHGVLPQEYQQPQVLGYAMPNYSGTRIVGGRLMGGDVRLLEQMQEEERWNPYGVRAYVDKVYADMEQRSVDAQVAEMQFGFCGESTIR